MFTGCKIINTSFKHVIVVLLLIVQRLKKIITIKYFLKKKMENHLLHKFQARAGDLDLD